MMPAPSSDPWTIQRANAARADALATFGFTDRQARFLVQVLLHAGVFLPRQYCQFAGIVHGQKTADLPRQARRAPLRDADHDWSAPSRPPVPRPLQAALGRGRRTRQPLSEASGAGDACSNA